MNCYFQYKFKPHTHTTNMGMCAYLYMCEQGAANISFQWKCQHTHATIFWSIPYSNSVYSKFIVVMHRWVNIVGAAVCHLPNSNFIMNIVVCSCSVIVICIVCNAYVMYAHTKKANQQIHSNKLASIKNTVFLFNVLFCPLYLTFLARFGLNNALVPYGMRGNVYTMRTKIVTQKSTPPQQKNVSVIIVYIDDTVPIYLPILRYADIQTPTNTSPQHRVMIDCIHFSRMCMRELFSNMIKVNFTSLIESSTSSSVHSSPERLSALPFTPIPFAILIPIYYMHVWYNFGANVHQKHIIW